MGAVQGKLGGIFAIRRVASGGVALPVLPDEGGDEPGDFVRLLAGEGGHFVEDPVGN